MRYCGSMKTVPRKGEHLHYTYICWYTQLFENTFYGNTDSDRNTHGS